MRYTIVSPVRGFTGEVAGVAFANSKAELDEDAKSRALAYFRRKGYTVEPVQPAAPAAPASDESEPDKKPAGRRAVTPKETS